MPSSFPSFYKPILAMVTVWALSSATARAEPITPDEFEAAFESMQETRFKQFFEEPPKSNKPLPSGYDEISGQAAFSYLERLTAFSQESKKDGDVLWGRIQGTPAERKATEYVQGKFREWGLQNIRTDQFPVTYGAWHPEAMSLDLVDIKGDTSFEFVSAATAFPSGETPKNGLVAPVVYVGMGTPADLEGIDLKGKIALVYVRAFDGVLFHSGLIAANRIANATEAAGIILWMDLPGNDKFAAQLFTPQGWIDTIPWINVGFQDGRYLRQLIEENPRNAPHVRLTVRGKLTNTATSQNLIAELPGMTDETIIITAHIDGYWNAILDNGTGVAGLMELARYYASLPLEKRQRRLVFLVSGDHELEGNGGSAVFEAMYPEIASKTVLALQFEHMVAPNAGNIMNTLSTSSSSASLSLFVSNGSDSVINAFREMVVAYDLTVRNSIQLNTAGDVDGLKTIPSAGLIQTGHYYHNASDHLGLYKPEDMERVTKAHAYLIDLLNAKSPTDLLPKTKRETLPPIYSSKEMMILLSPW